MVKFYVYCHLIYLNYVSSVLSGCVSSYEGPNLQKSINLALFLPRQCSCQILDKYYAAFTALTRRNIPASFSSKCRSWAQGFSQSFVDPSGYIVLFKR